MSELRLLHKTLYYALIEMRSCGQESGDKVVIHLADLFHNIVMQMGDVAEGGRSYSEVLENLKEAADRGGSRAWLDNVWSQIEKSNSSGQPDQPATDS